MGCQDISEASGATRPGGGPGAALAVSRDPDFMGTDASPYARECVQDWPYYANKIESEVAGRRQAKDLGLDEEEASVQTSTYAITQMSLALFFGPVFGGIGADNLGVPWTNTLVGLAILGTVLAAVKAMAYFDQNKKALV